MRILLYSHVFFPNYGGSGVVAQLLGEALAELGNSVTIFVERRDAPSVDYRSYVLREWSMLDFLWAACRSDFVLLMGPSLKALLTARLGGADVVVVHHMMAGRGWRDGIVSWASRLTTNIAPSRAVRDSFGFDMTIVANPYDDDVFCLPQTMERYGDLVFVGRIIPDKGLHVLIEALDRLGSHGLRPTLTVIGDGGDLRPMQTRVAELGLDAQVAFRGRLAPAAIARELQAHRVLVVPSVWEEPFGIVTLEGIACGCVPVVARSGGLPEAIGNCGLTFRRGDPDDLARTLVVALTSDEPRERLQREAQVHLDRHRKRTVAQAYLGIAALQARKRRRDAKRLQLPPVDPVRSPSGDRRAGE
jgi:glycogen(starch) synthase